MCLAIPACITEIGDGGLATVNILGAEREIALDLTPSAQIGDYVLVHAGFAIEIVDEQFAQETIDLIREFPDLAAEDLSMAAGGSVSGNLAGDSTGIPVGGSTGIPAHGSAGASAGAPGLTMQAALAELAEEL